MAKVKSKKDVSKKIPKLVESLALDTIDINEMHFEKNSKDKIETEKILADINVSAQLRKGEKGDGDLRAETLFTIKGMDENSEEELYTLKVSYNILYIIEKVYEWPEEEIDYFCSKNIMIHVWPYFREFANNFSNRANISPIILPLMPSMLKKEKISHARD